jgi:hypothetical protein
MLMSVTTWNSSGMPSASRTFDGLYPAMGWATRPSSVALRMRKAAAMPVSNW